MNSLLCRSGKLWNEDLELLDCEQAQAPRVFILDG
jgi:hypothetical protein